MDYKIVEIVDAKETSLDSYNRKQVVTKHYFINQGNKEVRDISFIDDWSQKDRIDIVENFFNNEDFYSAAIYESGYIVAFYVIGRKPLKSNLDYIELKQLQVSLEYRGKGLGKALFIDACSKALQFGAKRLYISAHSAIETQKAYEKLGCVDATWINEKAVKEEPYDIQMEYVLIIQ